MSTIAGKEKYSLEDFVISRVDAPASTPVIFVDHGIRTKGKKFISLAKLSDLERLVNDAVQSKLKSIKEQLPEKMSPIANGALSKEGYEGFNDALDQVNAIIDKELGYATAN